MFFFSFSGKPLKKISSSGQHPMDLRQPWICVCNQQGRGIKLTATKLPKSPCVCSIFSGRSHLFHCNGRGFDLFAHGPNKSGYVMFWSWCYRKSLFPTKTRLLALLSVTAKQALSSKSLGHDLLLKMLYVVFKLRQVCEQARMCLAKCAP